MRVTSLIAGLAALAFSQAAYAAAVDVAPVTFSPELQEALNDELGAREGEYLSAAVRDAVTNALVQRGATLGGGDLTLEIAILDADPNRPTLEQVSRRPGLDMMRSVSIGGAELRAVLRNAGGDVVSEVSHRRYNHTLADVGASTTWGEARHAIRQFAQKVGDAYAENAR